MTSFHLLICSALYTLCPQQTSPQAITLSVKDFKVSVPEAERAGPDLEHKFQMCIASGMEQYHRIASKAKTGSFTVCPTYGVDGPGPRHNPAVADPQPVYVRARADGGPVHDHIAAYNQQRLAHQEARAAAAYAKVGYAAQGPSPNGARQPKLRSPESKAAPAMVPLPSYNGPRYMQVGGTVSRSFDVVLLNFVSLTLCVVFYSNHPSIALVGQAPRIALSGRAAPVPSPRPFTQARSVPLPF